MSERGGEMKKTGDREREMGGWMDEQKQCREQRGGKVTDGLVGD